MHDQHRSRHAAFVLCGFRQKRALYKRPATLPSALQLLEDSAGLDAALSGEACTTHAYVPPHPTRIIAPCCKAMASLRPSASIVRMAGMTLGRSRSGAAVRGFRSTPIAATAFGGGDRFSRPINWGVVVVPQQRAWIVERFGKFRTTLQPGLNFLIPFVDNIAYVHSLKEEALPIPNQTAITRDNVTLSIDGVLYIRIDDPYKVRTHDCGTAACHCTPHIACAAWSCRRRGDRREQTPT